MYSAAETEESLSAVIMSPPQSSDSADMWWCSFATVFEMKEQRRMDSGGESPDALEEVFKKIQTVTGEDNLDMVVTRFIQGKL